MKRLLCLMCFLAIVSCKQSAESQFKIVSPKEVKNLLDNKDVQVIDVRTPEEYNEGFIKGAKNINFYSETFISDIESLDKQKPIIVYCKKGGRSAKSSQKLKDAGFIEIYDLDGGITKWMESGFVIENN